MGTYTLPVMSTLRAGGQSLYVRRLGRGPRRLIFLHGGPGLDHHVLLPLAAALSARLEVWLPDLPGHGRSHTEASTLPDLSSLLERTTRWLEALDPPVDLLAGHSLGAWLLREMLDSGRLKPKAAALLSCPVPPEQDDGSKTPPPPAGRVRARDFGRQFLDLCEEDSAGPLDPEFVGAVSRGRLRSPFHYEALQGQFRSAQRRPLRRVEPDCPLLVLTGSGDRICPPDDARRLAEATSGARLCVLEGAGHVPWATGVGPVERELAELVEEAQRRSNTK